MLVSLLTLGETFHEISHNIYVLIFMLQIMLHYSMYYPYAKEWLSVFPRDQFMMIKAEEFYANPVVVMREVFNFLGLGMYYHDFL